MPVSKLAKDLGVETDNVFSPSAQCTDDANKARRPIFMIRLAFQELSELVLLPLYGALVRPHLEYGMPACSPNLVADVNRLELAFVTFPTRRDCSGCVSIPCSGEDFGLT